MTKAIDGSDVRDVFRIVQGNADRRRELGELRRREIVGRAPYEREHSSDPRPRGVNAGIDVALGHAREQHGGARLES
jgi:hypothetical protein